MITDQNTEKFNMKGVNHSRGCARVFMESQSTPILFIALFFYLFCAYTELLQQPIMC